ncbi:MAG TPA: replication-associated recombination protein A, partial [Chthonomonadales bacterium]|nr:replication-associated recombination protein A [Chthonomonadales bacterium]
AADVREMPLAARMRPVSLDEFVGQQSIVGPGALLRTAIEKDQLRSVIFWGPPGSGKSTLAQIIAGHTRAFFENYSAVTSGVADVRRVISTAKERKRKLGRRTILLVDEIHRWTRAQQDALLPHVEDGTVILIGATTENPYFEVVSPLLSRARVFRFEPLSDQDIRSLLVRALSDSERGLGAMRAVVDVEALDHLAAISAGDARTALSALEAAVEAAPIEADGARRVTLARAEEGAQARALRYDRVGDEHYDTISAFIKSVRGSDPDAALYWLAKMLTAGEEIRFIARRLVILASEDIGNADPMALVVANAAAQAVMFVGLPEAPLILSQAVTYLAAAPKSNASMKALGRAMEEIEQHGAGAVPLHLRSGGFTGAAALGHGKDYLYPHDFPGHHVAQNYFPEDVAPQTFYEPTAEGEEARIGKRLEQLRKAALNKPV